MSPLSIPLKSQRERANYGALALGMSKKLLSVNKGWRGFLRADAPALSLLTSLIFVGTKFNDVKDSFNVRSAFCRAHAPRFKKGMRLFYELIFISRLFYTI